MAPKGKKGGAAAQSKEEEHDEPLQAVVLSDSFETKFAPFSVQVPRCLLPLVNTPLIEYTLQFLANSGVEEVYFVTACHSDEIESYLQQSKWTAAISPFSHFEIIRSQAKSTGEVMRDLDKRAVLQNDFIVVYGDIVSNLNLDSALAAHRKRRTADKNAIMTMVLKESKNPLESRYWAPWFVIDPRTSRCLHYEDIDPESDNQLLSFDSWILKDFDEITHRSDLLDCGIDIYTPEVLALWTDNFDFQTPRTNFLHQVLKDYELNGKTLHVHVEDSAYAKRVSSLKDYDSVSKDIITRATYPFSPDSNLYTNQRYSMIKRFVYKEQNVHLSRSCEIGPRTVLGDDTRIGEKTTISNSVIGKRCVIGNNVMIDNAYIWDDTVIKDDVTIRRAIIAGGSTIGKKSSVEPGALISFGVQVSENTTIKQNSRITTVRRKQVGDTEELENLPNEAQLVGEKGTGAAYIADEDEEDESKQKLHFESLTYDASTLQFAADEYSDLDSDSEDDEVVFEPTHRRSSTAGSILSNASIISDDINAESSRARDQDFHNEAVANLLESLQRGDESSNVQLELTSLRMASHVSEHVLRKAIVTAFMRHVSSLATAGKAIPAAVKSTIPPHKVMLNRNLFDKERDEKVDQVDLLLLVQNDLVHRKDGDVILMHVAHELVGLDILEAEGLEQWWNDGRSESSAELKDVKAKTKQLVDYLVADEEDSDDEDSD